MKRTPLFSTHQKLGGKLVEFGGWEMPVQYTSITEEHLAVRKAAGLFDISHMGKVLIEGKGAENFLNQTLTNDIRKLSIGNGQYTLMCNERGGVIDDLYAYRFGEDEYLLIINASRIDDDLEWLKTRLAATDSQGAVDLQDASEELGAVAVQGPKVREFIDQCFKAHLSELKKNQAAKVHFAGKDIWVSRTGYTGEDGFEVVAPTVIIEKVWDRILEIGAPYGLKPAGLGARDTLRTEACYPLYGHELDTESTPVEAGLSAFVSLNKEEFVGRSALVAQKSKGITRRLIAFKMTEKSAPPRPHYSIWNAAPNGLKLGEVTSGTQSPSLGIGIGMGYVQPASVSEGASLGIEIRGKRSPAVVVPKPFYRKPH